MKSCSKTLGRWQDAYREKELDQQETIKLLEPVFGETSGNKYVLN